MVSQSVFTISFRYIHLGLQETQAKEFCSSLLQLSSARFPIVCTGTGKRQDQTVRPLGHDQSCQVMLPDTLAMSTSYYCSSALGIQPTFLIQGAGQGFFQFIIPDQRKWDLVYCKQELFH